MHANVSSHHHPRRGMRGYIALWAALASLALAYLTALTLKPELVAPLARAPAGTGEGHKTAIRALAETGQIRQGVEELRQELAQVRDAIGKLEVREKETLARIEKIEAREKTGDRVAEAPETPPGTPPATPARLTEGKLRGGLQGPIIEGRIVDRPESPQAQPPPPPQMQLQPPQQVQAPEPPQPPQQVAAARPAPPTLPPVLPIQVSPGPVAPGPGVGFGTTVVKATPEPLGLLLATGPSVDALRLSWMLLNERHKATLKKLEPRAATGPEGSSGPSYQLIVGPVRNIDEANRLCAQLKARKVNCAPAQFAGEAL